MRFANFIFWKYLDFSSRILRPRYQILLLEDSISNPNASGRKMRDQIPHNIECTRIKSKQTINRN